MKLVVGLGNPGVEYENTRHNMGFITLNRLAEDLDNPPFKKGFKGEYAKTMFEGETVYLLKPMTYMNLSGESVKEFVDYFHINIEDIIVIMDDLALPPGRFRLRPSGSSGGQKGMQNIIDLLHTQDIKRIRIGVGEPENKNIVDYVLGKPSKDDFAKIDDAIDAALLGLKYYLATSDFNKAMSKFCSNKTL
jgi:peptidyl-tRNA hydrolase, PTH1 family